MSFVMLVIAEGFLGLAVYDYWEGWVQRNYQLYLITYYGVASATMLTLSAVILLPSPRALVVLAVDFAVMRVAWHYVGLCWHGIARLEFVFPIRMWRKLRTAAQKRRTSVRQLLLSFIRTGLYVHEAVRSGATVIYRDAEGEREVQI